MTALSRKALEKVRSAFDSAVSGLLDDDYREVIEEFQADLKARLEAIKEEQGDDD